MNRDRLPLVGGRLKWAIALFTAVVAVWGATPAFATFPGGNGKIAFTGSSGAGNSAIYTINADGTGQQSILASARDPSWSPDGSRLALTALFDFAIDIVNADGSGRSRVTEPGSFLQSDSDPDWSPNGSQLAFGRFFIFQEGSGSAVYSIRPDGSEERPLVGGYHPAWSPDGSHIAFVNETITYEEDEDGNLQEIHDYDIRVLDVATGTVTPLTSGRERDVRPDWSPDGSRIAFSRGELYTINLDGTGERSLTDPGDAVVSTFDADWQALPGPQRADYKNAAKFCKAERDFLGEQAFRDRYGGGANAHGKCVSSNQS